LGRNDLHLAPALGERYVVDANLSRNVGEKLLHVLDPELIQHPAVQRHGNEPS
jgi:hypothetical protein